jgi:putative membrane protein
MTRWPRGLVLYLAVSAIGLVWSGIAPFDRATWWLEVAPVIIGALLMVPTARRFPLSPLLYLLLSMHAIVLMIGGHWSYARVPMGDAVMQWFDLERNPYDRLGHLFQGFVPALLARELFLRTSKLGHGKWLVFVSIASPLAFSAFYELLEWWTALAAGAAATDFLGTQGDVWDTQWDMFLAGVGACAALATLSRVHDRSLARLSAHPASRSAG